ncbi:MAG: DUF3460 family protein [Burkholderiales bacterium]|jgi:hypothetical protein|nr:DUF3460 family protein [Burkholderiales bacterium]
MLSKLFLPSRHFLSDADAFLRDYLSVHPETIDQQKEGLQLWWEGQESEVRNQGPENVRAASCRPYAATDTPCS